MQYGAPLASFLQALAEEVQTPEGEANLERWVLARMESAFRRLGVDASDNVEGRIAKYFGLAYAAGLLAIRYGILPVSSEALRHAIKVAFEARLSRAGGKPAGTDIAAVVRGFIETNRKHFFDHRPKRGQSKRSDVEVPGFITGEVEALEFTFTRRQLRALCPGDFDTKHVCGALRKAGVLLHDTPSDGSEKHQTKRTLGGERRRVYCVSGRILALGARSDAPAPPPGTASK